MLNMAGTDKRHERGQGPICLAWLKGAQRHGIGLHHHVVLIDHHERQRDAGKKGLEPLGGALGGRLAVAQDLVLRLQLCLRCAQLCNQLGHVAAGPVGAAALRLQGRWARGIRVREQQGQVRAAHGGAGLSAGITVYAPARSPGSSGEAAVPMLQRRTDSSSISKFNVALGGITPPAPRAP